MKTYPELTYLRSILAYDKQSGVFTWKVALSDRVKIGGVAGTVHPSGRRVITINGQKFLANRLAWYYVTGELHAEIDHKNLSALDDRFPNLRPCTRSQNEANKPCRNALGSKGVIKRYGGRSWVARIKLNGTQRYLGTFPTFDLAKEFRDLAAELAFGEFARI